MFYVAPTYWFDSDEVKRYKDNCRRSNYYEDKLNRNMTKTHELISKHLVPVRDGRQFKRGNTKNKSRMGYRYTY